MVLSLCAVTARMKDGEFLSNVSAFPDLWSAYKEKPIQSFYCKLKFVSSKHPVFFLGLLCFDDKCNKLYIYLS